MDLDWQQCHRLNVTLLSIIGLWPYGNKFVLQLKRFVVSLFAFSGCFCQLATFFTVNYTRNLLLKNIPPICIGSAVVFKYISVLAASESIKKVTETIIDDFKLLTNKEEIRIIEKYVDRGRFQTKGFAMFIYPVTIPLILLPMSSVFLDTVIPLSETRNRTFAVMFELFFNQKKHFFLAVFLHAGFIIIAAHMFVSTEGLTTVYIHHACALFDVTSCRIRKLMSATGTKGSKETKNAAIMGQKSYYSKASTSDLNERYTYSHRYWNTLREEIIPSYIILLGFGVTSLAALLFRCIQASGSYEFTEFFISATCSFAILGYMFYLNFVIQNVLNSSGGIFNELYDINWYSFPISTQKLILFCMLCTIKPVEISLCSLFYPSFEGFSQLARMAISYAAALHSFQ